MGGEDRKRVRIETMQLAQALRIGTQINELLFDQILVAIK